MLFLHFVCAQYRFGQESCVWIILHIDNICQTKLLKLVKTYVQKPFQTIFNIL